MNKVIVSGSTGFVGNAVVRYLSSCGASVIALCRNASQNNRQNDLSNVCYYEFNLENAAQLLADLPKDDYSAFFHFAWAGSAGSERTDTVLQLKNVQWTVDCLKAAKNLGCRRFISAGSIIEHETLAATFAPENKPGLAYIYGSGKLAAHTMCSSIAADCGIELIWVLITNAYGPGETSPRLVNSTLRKCLQDIPPQFTSGTQNYDFVYIDDVARAFALIAESGSAFNEYLIGSSTARPLKEFLLEMKAAVAPDLEFNFGDVPFTGIDLPLSFFDCTKTQTDTGFRAEVDFAEGTKRTMQWIREQEML